MMMSNIIIKVLLSSKYQFNINDIKDIFFRVHSFILILIFFFDLNECTFTEQSEYAGMHLTTL